MNNLPHLPHFRGLQQQSPPAPKCGNHLVEFLMPYGIKAFQGRKYLAWFSFYEDKNVCYILEYDARNRITRYSISNEITVIDNVFLNTIFCGVIVTNNSFTDQYCYIIEDVYYYNGFYVEPMSFGEKLGYMENFIKKMEYISVKFVKPFFKEKRGQYQQNGNNTNSFCKQMRFFIPQIKLREQRPPPPTPPPPPQLPLTYNNISSHPPPPPPPTTPYEERQIIEIDTQQPTQTMQQQNTIFKKKIFKEQYKLPTIFSIMANIEPDIYSLYAFDNKTKKTVFYDIAHIGTIKTSIFMNEIYRNIRENKNIDYIEESDDEDDFENTTEDKYVDLTKMHLIECVFNQMFKKWTPVRLIMQPQPQLNNSAELIVNISKL